MLWPGVHGSHACCILMGLVCLRMGAHGCADFATCWLMRKARVECTCHWGAWHLFAPAHMLRCCRIINIPFPPRNAGFGVYRFEDKYGANVDGYSPIYTPDQWTADGQIYKLGTKGLIAW